MQNEGLKLVITADAVQAIGGLEKFKKSVSTATNEVKKMPNVTNQATFALTNLSRVAQDAPYGFIGIANNLNPLLESFQRLKQSTGTTGGALKALGQSLTGAGGIGLALGVVSSLLVVFGDRLFGAKKKTEEETKATDEAAAKQKEFQTAIDSAARSVVNQSDKITILRANLLGAADDVGTLTQAVINQGVAAFIFDKKNVEIQKILGAEIQKSLKLRKQLNIAASVPEYNSQLFSKDPLEKTIGEGKASLGILNALGDGLQEFFKKLVDKKSNAPKTLKQIEDEIIDDARKFAKEFEGKFILPDLEESFTNTRDKILAASKKLLDDIKNENLTPLLRKVFVEVTPTLTNRPKDISKFQEEVKRLQDNIKKPSDLKVFDTPGKAFDALKNRNTALLNDARNNLLVIDENARRISGTISDALTPAFSGLFDAILAGEDPIKAMFKGILQSINQVIQKLIAAAIQAAALSLITGGASAGGTSFLSAFKGILGFAEGGLVSSPTLSMIGEGAGTRNSNPEVVAPLNKLKAMLGDANGGSVNVSGRLVAQGSQLVAVIENTNRRNERSY